MADKYRLVTRSDFDGLVSGALLKSLNMIDEVKFVHPKDMQDGKIEITNKDITTNLPYVEAAHLAFDHHISEVERVGTKNNYVTDPDAASCAGVVYEYFGEDKFPNIDEDILFAVDKVDSGNFSQSDVLHPEGWVLLSFIMDSRTGLGRFKDFKISNYDLMMMLMDKCIELPLEDILKLPDVVERTDLFFEQEEKFKDQLNRCSKIYGNLILTDMRKEDPIFAGNRFMVYALYPDQNISIQAMWGRDQMNTVFAIGKSIVNLSSNTNIGELCLKYGGGGHEAAGTCQVDNDKAGTILKEIVQQINADS
ncbi:MAG: exopolyphosphatase [Nitrospinaceae bacterium]|jgi:nanoRNase/pAp phosphatase (c-di-AMP/oligoRNAs hydrolase)|nr:exopolyphosphatase [Nitrospinaceae bacterium]MBT3435746.1 exopolyphosphatase [Nitrospinaceae bacterium]MBT3821457.1 exopolyphosphatase [Nitrospinaceae bacterium]MBT4092871.1 exopolyphosphatase [Nitrospinaceae bacterium]MBT4429235.1 exopolyphosphatase [Nitrospinaceae bacterium]